MKDLDLRLEVVSGSRQLLRYIWRWISRKPLEIEVWFQRSKGLLIENGIMAYRMVTWSMTSRDLERSNSWPQYAESAISRKWLDLETVPKDHQYEMAYRDMGYQIVTWPMTSHDPRRCCETVRSAILATAWLLVTALSHCEPYTRRKLLQWCLCNSHIRPSSLNVRYSKWVSIEHWTGP